MSRPYPFTYEAFCTQEEIDTFKRVKRRQMRLAKSVRLVLAEMSGGRIGDGSRSGKQFLRTRYGTYRIALGHKSDNSTEAAAHLRMGVQTLWVGEPDSFLPWLKLHDLTWEDFWRALVAEVQR